jgi:hypothetical protein
MTTAARKRRVPDVLRMGQAMSHPGIDPRTWVTTARIDMDPLAVRWDPEIGPIADVTFTGGPLDGEGPIPCRVAYFGQGAGTGRFIPLQPGDEVQVCINAGNPEEGPVIVGTLANGGGSEAPTSVCSLPILPTPGAVSVPLVAVSPYDTEISVSTGNLAEQYDGATLRQSARATIQTSGPASLMLGSPLAAEPFLKGLAYTTQEQIMLTSLAAAFTALATASAVAPLTPLAAQFTAAAAALSAFIPAMGLSQKIMGE